MFFPQLLSRFKTIEIIVKIKANLYKEIAQFTILVAIIGNKISKYFFLTRLSQMGKSGFRFSKSKSGFPIRTRNPKTDFISENPSSEWISIKKSKSGFFGFPFLLFDWEIRKRIC